MNLKGITKNRLMSFLSDFGIQYGVTKDGDLYTLLNADSDFNHDVVIFFIVSEGMLGLTASACDFSVPDHRIIDALLAINEYNTNTKLPKVYLRGNTIIAEQWYSLDEEVSEEYIKHNCIAQPISVIWQFFCRFTY